MKIFKKVTIIGIGLIGSSLALAIRKYGLAETIICGDASAAHCATALDLKLVDHATTDLAEAVRDADLVVIATPVSSFSTIAAAIGPHLKAGCIVTDVGSTKQSAVRDIAPHLPKGVQFVPGHPIAGTEHSGPAAGFAELFQGRWCILTPLPDTDPVATTKLRQMWEHCGCKIELMTPEHHDRVLAITSHLPHLIAYTIVGTADDLSEDIKQEVIRYSASGFHDFTRIAASDPIMWRDIFLNNREAVLEIVQRFTEDLTALQRAIRRGEGETLEKLFAHSRVIRRGITQAKQAEPLAQAALPPGPAAAK
jgi:cyclohexadieny/prephenate dehydrogenase